MVDDTRLESQKSSLIVHFFILILPITIGIFGNRHYFSTDFSSVHSHLGHIKGQNLTQRKGEIT